MSLYLLRPKLMASSWLCCFICGIVIVSCDLLNQKIPQKETLKSLSSIGLAQAKEAIIHSVQSPRQDWVHHMSIPKKPNNYDDVSKKTLATGQVMSSVEGMSSVQSSASNNEHKTDALRNLSELITSEGYPCERFTVQTEDGFLLGLYRIPNGKNNVEASKAKSTNRPAIFLQHGLLSSACDWVMNFQNDSLGFILADAGYDVWMGNSRGNTYSRRHITYSPDEAIFWDWSFDEMAKYDTTAFIDFILNKTGHSSLHYIGHSQGTTMAFALMAHYPAYQNKIRSFMALAPAISLTHVKSPIIYLAKLPDEVLHFLFGDKDFLPNDYYVKFAVDHMCKLKATRWICNNILLLIVGPDTSNFNQSRLTVYMNHSPAGVSAKDIIHYAQLHRQSEFTMYNYGSDEANEKHYGQPNPPTYDVTKVNVPTVLFSGTHDWIASPENVKSLRALLPNVKAWYELPKWNHLDFVWGEDAANMCYKKILSFLPKF